MKDSKCYVLSFNKEEPTFVTKFEKTVNLYNNIYVIKCIMQASEITYVSFDRLTGQWFNAPIVHLHTS